MYLTCIVNYYPTQVICHWGITFCLEFCRICCKSSRSSIMESAWCNSANYKNNSPEVKVVFNLFFLGHWRVRRYRSVTDHTFLGDSVFLWGWCQSPPPRCQTFSQPSVLVPDNQVDLGRFAAPHWYRIRSNDLIVSLLWIISLTHVV